MELFKPGAGVAVNDPVADQGGEAGYEPSTRVPELLNLYARLSVATLDAVLACYAEDAWFKDPFNEVHGRTAIRAIFMHMFETTERARFDILDHCAQGNQHFVTWIFRCELAGRELAVQGASHLICNARGEVQQHRDYWDPAEEMWQHLPWLGPVVKWLRARFKVEVETK